MNNKFKPIEEEIRRISVRLSVLRGQKLKLKWWNILKKKEISQKIMQQVEELENQRAKYRCLFKAN